MAQNVNKKRTDDTEKSSSNEGYLLLESSSVQHSSLQIEDKIGVQSFIPIQLLGKGSFGEVYLVQKKKGMQMYAMKVLSK